jgi:hypothetical protein
MVGVLRIENAIALFELGGAHEHGMLAIQLGQVAVFAVTIALCRWYLKVLGASTVAQPESPVEGPTL